jgi:imidazoleglycerol-phosphate dehydratase
MSERKACLKRQTGETRIEVAVNLDGSGEYTIETGIGFFDHMLSHLARHGLFDITVRAEGDLHVDPHHTVEDVGICLGKAFLEAVGSPAGLTRYGAALVPMDEALAEVAVDFSGRPFLVYNADLRGGSLGGFDVELAQEFMQAFSVHARVTLHVNLQYGTNTHHCLEGIFKAWARALKMALSKDARVSGVPSTKGMLES